MTLVALSLAVPLHSAAAEGPAPTPTPTATAASGHSPWAIAREAMDDSRAAATAVHAWEGAGRRRGVSDAMSAARTAVAKVSWAEGVEETAAPTAWVFVALSASRAVTDWGALATLAQLDLEGGDPRQRSRLEGPVQAAAKAKDSWDRLRFAALREGRLRAGEDVFPTSTETPSPNPTVEARGTATAAADLAAERPTWEKEGPPELRWNMSANAVGQRIQGFAVVSEIEGGKIASGEQKLGELIDVVGTYVFERGRLVGVEYSATEDYSGALGDAGWSALADGYREKYGAPLLEKTHPDTFAKMSRNVLVWRTPTTDVSLFRPGLTSKNLPLVSYTWRKHDAFVGRALKKPPAVDPGKL